MSGTRDNSPTEPEPATRGNQPVHPTSEHYVVGIGASAGGLPAISELLKAVGSTSSLAFIVLQHLDMRHESSLVDILGRVTTAPVRWAVQGDPLRSGEVLVVPPHTSVAVKDRAVYLSPNTQQTGHEIDQLFRALAGDLKDCAVGVVLSGTGNDGASGLRAIKSHGGLSFAQEPTTAQFAEMPRAAIDLRCVDRILSPTGIAKELLRLTSSRPPLQPMAEAGSTAPETEPQHMATLFRLLANRTGVNFTEYKQSTIRRRLRRRMILTNVSELPAYLQLLQKNRDELQQLYESLLINVTEFFRDEDCFAFLRSHVLPEIIRRHADNSPIRLWVPGCATGEEVYSIGIVVREALEESGHFIPVQIFGTDVTDSVIDEARAGRYTENDVAHVSPDRVRRFFEQTPRGFVIRKSIRDMCVFARQNVVRDSPFSRLDLISCRNLLIYFGPELQRKLMPVFHYALSPTGYLMLGSSESVGNHADLYRLVDRRFPIYTRKSGLRRPTIDFAPDPGTHSATHTPFPPSLRMADDMKEPFDVMHEADRLVLSRHGPIGVVVNEELDILQFRGDVSAFLTPLPGRATLNLLKMARDGLAAELQMALQEAREGNARVQRRGLLMMNEQATRVVDIDVTPIVSERTKERFYLVLFSTTGGEGARAGGEADAGEMKAISESTVVQQLRNELQSTRTYLQSTIERHEATNQELRAVHEEIQSSNEELQSTNEELETAKEELQSTNEELTTVNEELHNRQLELVHINNDLHNLINSVHLPIVILGADLRIRRFTPMAERVLNIIPTDIGRPFSDINIGLDVPDLPKLIAEVIDSLTTKEVEVRDGNGRWYSLRLRPYKTADNKIDGAVLTLIDIDALKRAVREAEEAARIAETVMEMTREPLAVLTPDLRIDRANDAFCRLLRIEKTGVERRSFFDVVQRPDAPGELRTALEGRLCSTICG